MGSLTPIVELISVLSFSRIWAFSKRQQRVEVTTVVVVSWPTIVNRQISSARLSSKLGVSFRCSIRFPMMVWFSELPLLFFFSWTIRETSALSFPLTPSLSLLNLLQSALKFMPAAVAPNTMTKGWKQSFIERALICLMASSRGSPSTVSSSRLVPRNSDTTTLPKALLRRLSRSTLILVPSWLFCWDLSSSLSSISQKILTKLGICDMMKLWVNTFDSTFFLFFHSSPSMKSSEFPQAYLIIPKKLTSFWTVIRDSALLKDWASLGLMMPNSIWFEILVRATSQPTRSCLKTWKASLWVETPLRMRIMRGALKGLKAGAQTLQPLAVRTLQQWSQRRLGARQNQLKKQTARIKAAVNRSSIIFQFFYIIEEVQFEFQPLITPKWKLQRSLKIIRNISLTNIPSIPSLGPHVNKYQMHAQNSSLVQQKNDHLVIFIMAEVITQQAVICKASWLASDNMRTRLALYFLHNLLVTTWSILNETVLVFGCFKLVERDGKSIITANSEFRLTYQIESLRLRANYSPKLLKYAAVGIVKALQGTLIKFSQYSVLF